MLSENCCRIIENTILLHKEKDELEADKIRDNMDADWYQLSEQEERLVRGLSADLYDLENHVDIFQPKSKGPILQLGAEHGWLNVLEDYIQKLDWIRENKDNYSLYDVNQARSLIWTLLEQEEASIIFI
jgi:hypothetical protein